MLLPTCRIFRSLPNQRRRLLSTSTYGKTVNLNGREYPTDRWTNLPSSIIPYMQQKLHLQLDHPISITRQLIESQLSASQYTHYNDLDPVVSVYENFDSLGFPHDHPGRNQSDTYYVNQSTVLRTHTSAHEAQIFRDNKSSAYTISADVYRRDTIDRSHYPVFHQMEGAMIWDRRKSNILSAIQNDVGMLKEHDLEVQDPNPAFHIQRNPLQNAYHSPLEAEAIASHLKRTLERVVAGLFTHARHSRRLHLGSIKSENVEEEEPLKIRWVEAYFPFTSPSWELEILWQGDWLEVLGCGITKQEIHINSGLPHQIGWAFGLGLERLAMILYSIPDIRLFWSKDQRFLKQFSHTGALRPFVPFSKYPACYKDVSFWVPEASVPAGRSRTSTEVSSKYHENDVMETIRGVGGDLVENVALIDEFTHPLTLRRSVCYRIDYRSLERTLTNEEADSLHDQIRNELVMKLGVELR